MLVTQQKVLRRFWYCTMPLGELDSGPRPFTLLGEHLVLWRDAQGQPAALQDRCCHRTAKLSKGYCDEGNIVCGYHGNAESALRATGDTTVRKRETLWFMPFARRLGITYPNGLKHYIVTNATPNDDGTMTLVQWCYRNDREEDVPATEVVAWDRKI